MPELPEVETIKSNLASHINGARITRPRLHRADLRYPFPENFTRRLDGAIITQIDRRGKYILIHLDTGEIWVTHLGMTGRFEVMPVGPEPPPDDGPQHLHFECLATQGQNVLRVRFYDRRRFGFMLLFSGESLERETWYRELGPEPLSAAFNATYFRRMAAKRRTTVKALLMDQAIVAGLGNIYACEALWEAHLRPLRACHTLTEAEVGGLVAGVKRAIKDAIRAGNAALHFPGKTGRDGYFNHAYKVYGREGCPCERDDGGKIERVTDKGRSTFYCPACQK